MAAGNKKECTGDLFGWNGEWVSVGWACRHRLPANRAHGPCGGLREQKRPHASRRGRERGKDSTETSRERLAVCARLRRSLPISTEWSHPGPSRPRLRVGKAGPGCTAGGARGCEGKGGQRGKAGGKARGGPEEPLPSARERGQIAVLQTHPRHPNCPGASGTPKRQRRPGRGLLFGANRKAVQMSKQQARGRAPNGASRGFCVAASFRARPRLQWPSAEHRGRVLKIPRQQEARHTSDAAAEGQALASERNDDLGDLLRWI